jgi:RNA polymerase sigma-70 factor (ECF subfamily)
MPLTHHVTVESMFMDAFETEAEQADRARAFREIVEPELPVLLRVARGLTRTSADAEDLVQETLIRAFKAILKFDGAHPRAWLFTILRNTNVNMNRRTRPSLFIDGTLWEDATPAFGDDRRLSAEETAINRSMSAEIQKGFKDLDPRFREVLYLVDIQGLNYGECAASLGVPIGTVMSRLSRGRKRLREHLMNTSALKGISK